MKKVSLVLSIVFVSCLIVVPVFAIDSDLDGIPDDEDNCPQTPNGYLGTCKSGDFIGSICIVDVACGLGGVCSLNQEDSDNDGAGDVCDDCPFDPDNDIDNDDICGDVDNCPNHYNPGQEDTMPPGGNNCGDICECESDFDGDGDIDGTDLGKFKQDLFRNDCSTESPCNGDFDCNGIVDGRDATRFSNFRVEFFRKDCPSCGGWPCF